MITIHANRKTPFQRAMQIIEALALLVIIVGTWQRWTYEIQPRWTDLIFPGILIMVGAKSLLDPASHMSERGARWLGILSLISGVVLALLNLV